MDKTYVFVYGTLTRTKLVQQMAPGAKSMGQYRLNGWMLESHNYLSVHRREPHNYVMGLVWEIDDIYLEWFDHYEGYPEMYSREEVQVGGGLKVWVYVLNEEHRNFAVPLGSHGNARLGYVEHGLPLTQIDDAVAQAYGLPKARKAGLYPLETPRPSGDAA